MRATNVRSNARGQRRPRRGATLVLVALFAVVLVGLSAFAIDISRLYVGVNELQTAADATALRGALFVQKSPGTDGSSVMTTFAANNEALGGPVSITATDIESGSWIPAAGNVSASFTPYAWNDARVNAVRVSARQSTRLLFAGVLNRVVDVPERRAIAWVANITGVDCIKPWGLDRSVLGTKIGVNLTTQSGVNELKELLTTSTGLAQLTVVMSPSVNGGPSVTQADGFFQAVTGDQNASPNSYEDLIVGAGCGNGTAEVKVATVFQQPGQGNQVAQRADAIVRQTNTEKGPCKKGLTAGDATCYDPALPGYVAGPIIVVPITLPAAQPNRTEVKMLTRFRLMCAFTDDPSGNPLGASSERCPWLATVGRTDTGYRRSTIVGYPVAGFADLGGGTELGNTISTGQRMILVR